MEFGVHLPQIGWQGQEAAGLDRLIVVTTAAERLGFGTITAHDHLVYGRPWLDGPTALAAVLAAAPTVRLMTSVSLPVVGAVPDARSASALVTARQWAPAPELGEGVLDPIGRPDRDEVADSTRDLESRRYDTAVSGERRAIEHPLLIDLSGRLVQPLKFVLQTTYSPVGIVERPSPGMIIRRTPWYTEVALELTGTDSVALLYLMPKDDDSVLLRPLSTTLLSRSSSSSRALTTETA